MYFIQPFVFQKAAQGIVDALLEGYNGTIFAYGIFLLAYFYGD